ncbi:MAG: DUF4465 domain-containing protein [Bacteroidota bacterium]|jgi:hypothetical protein
MRKIILCFSALFAVTFSAQTVVSTIDDYSLPTDSFYNGLSGGNGFQSGNIFYPTVYDSNFQYWASGFAASNMKDSATSGYLNVYSAKTASGCLGSSNYAIAQNYAVARFTGASQQDSVYGFYVTNSTYAYNSMRDGDAFAKKFGGLNGNDPDWFLLTVKKYFNGVLYNDSVYFYLADYRFSNNNNDYILDSWQWVNCKSLGKADSLLFVLSSSDIGQFGMNTPAFFAIDNLTTKATFVGMNEIESDDLKVFPNPFSDVLTFLNKSGNSSLSFELSDMSGRIILKDQFSGIDFKINVADLTKGIYLLTLQDDKNKFLKRIVKD